MNHADIVFLHKALGADAREFEKHTNVPLHREGGMGTRTQTDRMIQLRKPGPSPSLAYQSIAEDNWSHFSGEARTDYMKGWREWGGNNPVDPKRFLNLRDTMELHNVKEGANVKDILKPINTTDSPSPSIRRAAEEPKNWRALGERDAKKALRDSPTKNPVDGKDYK